jgi:tripartite ATP-independent transporter DctP family solute receptor
MKRWTLTAAALALSAGAAAAQTEVRIASHVSDTSPLYTNAELFAERIAAATGDAFSFTFYPNGQLGKETALIDNIKLGTLEMAMVASGVLKLDPKLGVFDLPWLFADREAVMAALSGPFGEAVQGFIEDTQGFVVLGIYENGFRHVVNTERPIETPADMEGLKVRVTGSAFKRAGFSAMGADPVPIAWTETFTAIQQGVVDGAEAALYGFYGAKLYEISDYLSLTSHTWSPSFLIVSGTFWAQLTDEQKAIFRETAAGMFDEAFAQAAEQETRYLEEMRGAIAVNEVDARPFQQKAQDVYDDYIAAEGDDWLTLLQPTN